MLGLDGIFVGVGFDRGNQEVKKARNLCRWRLIYGFRGFADQHKEGVCLI